MKERRIEYPNGRRKIEKFNVCTDCPGPGVLNLKDTNNKKAIDCILAKFQDHIKETEAQRRLTNAQVLEKFTQLKEEFVDKLGTLKNWAIGNLVALIFVLIGTIIAILH